MSEFDIDGLRLDAADVLDFGFMQTLRRLADEVKPDFWLMGEVIHGDYSRWVNASMLHSVTDYTLHKALYSGHNDHNYFEIAHTVNRIHDMGLNRPGVHKLYNFADNHDVERIYTRLQEKAHFVPVHILLYTLGGIPSIYYGSEFGIEGRKERGSDDSLRPALSLEDYQDALSENPYTRLIASLGRLRQNVPALIDGDYRELLLTTRQYVFSRTLDGCGVIVAVNNDSSPAELHVPAKDGSYTGALSGQKLNAADSCLTFTIPGDSGEIWIPDGANKLTAEPALREIPKTPPQSRTQQPAPTEEKTAPAAEPRSAAEPARSAAPVSGSRSYEEMTVEELQSAILEKLAKNGPVTDRMRQRGREYLA